MGGTSQSMAPNTPRSSTPSIHCQQCIPVHSGSPHRTFTRRIVPYLPVSCLPALSRSLVIKECFLASGLVRNGGRAGGREGEGAEGPKSLSSGRNVKTPASVRPETRHLGARAASRRRSRTVPRETVGRRDSRPCEGLAFGPVLPQRSRALQ